MKNTQPAGDQTPRTAGRRAGGKALRAAGKQRSPAKRARAKGAGTGRAGTGRAGTGRATRPRPAEPQVKVRVGSVAGLLAVVPRLIGFYPARSLVVVGVGEPLGRIRLTFRYDLPDPPDEATAREIAEHAAAVLGNQQIARAVVVGYGPGALVTPVAEGVRDSLLAAGVALQDVLRVEDGRYWSYQCHDPRCCPPEGTEFDSLGHPAAAQLAMAGLSAYPNREALADSLAPVTGAAAESMAAATELARQRLWKLIAAGIRSGGGTSPQRAMVDAGRSAVRDAIAAYRDGGQVTDDVRLAWLTVTLADIRVRDDAWARMDPHHVDAHRRLWTDLVRRACPEYLPAPASLLAFTAWQSGDGALANMALDRALAADPDYSMAHLLDRAVSSGLPPSAARLPMTPEEVEASYDEQDRARAARARGEGGTSASEEAR